MSDPTEDRLRSHLADRASAVPAAPDTADLLERSVARSGRMRRRLMVVGTALVAVLATSGVLGGVELAGGTAVTPTASPAPATAPSTTTTPGRAGADLAPAGAGADLPTPTPAPYTPLFSRTTTSGVTIRAYTAAQGGTGTGTCGTAATCPPSGEVPGPVTCPTGAMCAQPLTGGTSGGATGSGSSAGSAAASTTTTTPPTTTPVPPVIKVPPVATVPPVTSQPPVTTEPPSSIPPTDACASLVLEFSNAGAVGTAELVDPGARPASDTVQVLGAGSFGAQEGAPVAWVAVEVGGDVSSVQLTSAGTVVDTMTPASGIAVLAVAGTTTVTGATVEGLGSTGTVVATAPADQAPSTAASAGCTASPSPSTTTTTVPASPTPNTTPTTTPVPVDPPVSVNPGGPVATPVLGRPPVATPSHVATT
jgi:hypothetical protein